MRNLQPLQCQSPAPSQALLILSNELKIAALNSSFSCTVLRSCEPCIPLSTTWKSRALALPRRPCSRKLHRVDSNPSQACQCTAFLPASLSLLLAASRAHQTLSNASHERIPFQMLHMKDLRSPVQEDPAQKHDPDQAALYACPHRKKNRGQLPGQPEQGHQRTAVCGKDDGEKQQNTPLEFSS